MKKEIQSNRNQLIAVFQLIKPFFVSSKSFFQSVMPNSSFGKLQSNTLISESGTWNYEPVLTMKTCSKNFGLPLHCQAETILSL